MFIRQMISSDENIVGRSKTDDLLEVAGNTIIDCGDDAIAIGHMDGDIMQAEGEAKMKDKISMVEAFCRHVETERGRMMALLKQAQAEEYVFIFIFLHIFIMTSE